MTSGRTRRRAACTAAAWLALLAPAAAPALAGDMPAAHTGGAHADHGQAHADHNSKHGGQFYMAPDRRHHLEGVLDETFRVYLYDDHTRPVSALPFAAGASATALRLDTHDADADEPIALVLVPVTDGSPLEFRLPADAAKCSLREL